MNESKESAHVPQEQPVPTSPDFPPVAPTEPSEPSSPDATSAPSGPDPAQILRSFANKAKVAATATLDMGRLARDYIRARMSLSADVSREVCVRVLAHSWEEWSDKTIKGEDVNRLVRLWSGFELFNAQTQHKPGKVSLRVIREFCVLAERDVDSREERWAIVPALAEKALAKWEEITSKGLTGEDAAHVVAQLIEEHKRALAEQAAKRAATPNATPEDKAKAEKAKEDAQKAQENAEKKGQRAKKDTPATATVKDPTPAPKPEVPCRGENLLATLASTAKQGTAKDFAALLASAALKSDDPLALIFDLASALVTGSNTPDDVLRALISGAKDSKALSKPATRAADAALVILSASDKPVAKAS